MAVSAGRVGIYTPGKGSNLPTRTLASSKKFTSR